MFAQLGANALNLTLVTCGFLNSQLYHGLSLCACFFKRPSVASNSHERTTESEESTGNSGVLKWYIKGEHCLKYWQANGASCANYISVCPFTYGYESEHCAECERCEPFMRGCPLQSNTFFRKKYGYLEDTPWASKSKIPPTKRRGL